MKEAGLFTGVFGIEVTTASELKKLAKGITIEQIKRPLKFYERTILLLLLIL